MFSSKSFIVSALTFRSLIHFCEFCMWYEIGVQPHFLLQIFSCLSTTFFFNFYFYFGCVGSSFLCEGFLQLWQVGAALCRGARASHYHGLSCCGAQAPDVQAQQLWLTCPVAPRHVGSSQTRARTHVPCIGRQTLSHCATKEAQHHMLKKLFFLPLNCLGTLVWLEF